MSSILVRVIAVGIIVVLSVIVVMYTAPNTTNFWEPIHLLNILLVFGLGYLASYLSLRTLHQTIRNQKHAISKASHDLRTPLSAMRLNADIALLNRDSLTLDEAVKTIEDSKNSIDRMSDIIQDFRGS